MDDWRIRNGLLYGELATGASRARLQLRFKDVHKREIKACNIDTESWESLADTRALCKQQLSQGLKRGEAAIQDKNEERRARRKASHQWDYPNPQQASVFICQGCSRDCKSRIGLSTATQDDAHRQPLTALLHSHWLTDANKFLQSTHDSVPARVIQYTQTDTVRRNKI